MFLPVLVGVAGILEPICADANTFGSVGTIKEPSDLGLIFANQDLATSRPTSIFKTFDEGFWNDGSSLLNPFAKHLLDPGPAQGRC